MNKQPKNKIPFETPEKKIPHHNEPETDPEIGPGNGQPCEDVPKPLQDDE